MILSRKIVARTWPAMVVAAVCALAGAAREAQAVDISGCWDGCWSSDYNGHHGPLKATIVRLDAQSYAVQFRGRFFKVIPFVYAVVLDVVAEDDASITLAGSHSLGRKFGTFSYTATVTAEDFNARFNAGKDHGCFSMKKVASLKSCCQ